MPLSTLLLPSPYFDVAVFVLRRSILSSLLIDP
jgi:hypothetical protein